MHITARHIRAALMTVIFTMVTVTQAMALSVNDARIGLHPDKTRLVFELSEMSKFKTFVLSDPYRLVVDMPDFQWSVGRISNPKASAVSGIRQGDLKPGYSRIVIDLKRPVYLTNAFLLRKNGSTPDRLVVDFVETNASGFAANKGKSFGILEVGDISSNAAPVTEQRTASAPPPVPEARPAAPVPPSASAPVSSASVAVPAQKPAYTPPAANVQTLPTPAPAQEQNYAASGMAIPQKKPGVAAAPPPAANVPYKKPLIVIDPGHGGVDPGAIASNGVFEKHVALAMGKELKRQLESTGRYDVIMTRDRDEYKRLYKRVEFARQHGADLFISLHADSIGKSSVRGASIYTLSEKASDQQTARLAERENKADHIAGVDLGQMDEDVAFILGDMIIQDTKNQSRFFGNTIEGSFNNHSIKMLSPANRHAGFAVLKAPDIPSVLIELGFMSNKNEAQMLSQPQYREKVARAIATGVDTYFRKVAANNGI